MTRSFLSLLRSYCFGHFIRKHPVWNKLNTKYNLLYNQKMKFSKEKPIFSTTSKGKVGCYNLSVSWQNVFFLNLKDIAVVISSGNILLWTKTSQNKIFCKNRNIKRNFLKFSRVIFDQYGLLSFSGSNFRLWVSTTASRGRCCLDSSLWWCWSGLWSSEESSQPLSCSYQKKTAACWSGSAVFSGTVSPPLPLTRSAPPVGHSWSSPDQQLQSPQLDAAAAVVWESKLSSPGCLLSPAWSLTAVWGTLDPGETWAAQCSCWFFLCVTSPPAAFWAAETTTKSLINIFSSVVLVSIKYNLSSLITDSSWISYLPCGSESDAAESRSLLQWL